MNLVRALNLRRCIPVLCLVAVAMFCYTQAMAGSIPVPNGSFEEVYKPGSTTITADLGGGWTNGVGPDTPMQSGQTATYSDGTDGSVVDVPGWINVPGWPPSYDWPVGAGSIGKQTATPAGTYYYMANGSNWGNPQGGAIESAAALATIDAGTSYTVSMLVNGPIVPVVLELMADGVPLTPSATTDPGAPYDWDEVSKTYDAASLAGVVGQDLTIRVGFGTIDQDPPATGTQSRIDDVTLTTVVPEPSTLLLAVIGLLSLVWCGRRR